MIICNECRDVAPIAVESLNHLIREESVTFSNALESKVESKALPAEVQVSSIVQTREGTSDNGSVVVTVYDSVRYPACSADVLVADISRLNRS